MSILDKASLIQIPSGYKNGKLYSVKPNPSYGSEQISNGDFSNGSTGWTVTNGTVTDKYNASMTAYQNGIKISTFSLTGTYKLIFDLTITSGNCKFDGGGSNSQTYTTSGRKELTITNPTKFEFNAFNLGWVGTLDNVSVKEVIVADGDFTFARSSSGTRVNSEGLIETASVLGSELITNGDFATDSDWTKGVGWTISGGTANSDNSGSGTRNLRQDNILEVGKTYEIKFDLNITSGTLYLIFGGTLGLSQSQSYTLTRTSTSTDLVFRNSNGNFIGSIDNVSVKEVIENDVPRLDYSGGASCACLLLEPQSTNLVTYSEDFSQWNAINNVIVTDNFTTSPDGTQNASKLVFDGTTIGRIELSVSASGTNTQSVYLKTESGTQNVSIGAGTADLTEFTITNQWVRYSHTGGGTYPRILCNDAATIYVYGAQFEQGSYATSYIPTNGSTVTRTADVCNNAGTSATFNSTEGVLFAEIAALANDGTKRRITINNGSSTQFVQLEYSVTTNTIKVGVYNGSLQGFFTETLSDLTTFNKIAYSYKANEFKLFANGIQLSTTITSGTTFSSGTLSTLSFDNGASADDFYGKTKQLMVFDEALSDEELSDLTGQVNLSFNNLATFYGYTIL
jgi:hypothetical protein